MHSPAVDPLNWKVEWMHRALIWFWSQPRPDDGRARYRGPQVGWQRSSFQMANHASRNPRATRGSVPAGLPAVRQARCSSVWCTVRCRRGSSLHAPYTSRRRCLSVPLCCASRLVEAVQQQHREETVRRTTRSRLERQCPIVHRWWPDPGDRFL